MIVAPMAQDHLIDRLPAVRGRYTADAPLSGITWFRVGGPAEVMFRPADADDLAAFLAARPRDVPVTVLGVASNLLVRDGGIPGVVIRLGRAFAEVAATGWTIRAGAGALDANVAKAARDAGIGGLEFLSGVPGTIGGALRMNAGAYGGDMKTATVSATILDASGERRVLTGADIGFVYRGSTVPDDTIFVAAELAGAAASPLDIARRMEAIATTRAESQPIRSRTGGSTFTNPASLGGVKAWQLIEAAGCRGLRQGGVMVSEKHCNFLINTGGATAAEIEALGDEVRRRVIDNSGIALEWEIRRVGVPAEGKRTS